jgi:hypothetical protein
MSRSTPISPGKNSRRRLVKLSFHEQFHQPEVARRCEPG